MPPVVSIVGRSNSGKTTLVEELLQELKSRGYRVATVKHAPHGINLDDTGKDSSRHIQAGSEATAVCSRDRVMVIKPATPSITLDEVVRFIGEDYDIILAEGFKQDNAPKIEVHRREIGPPLSAVKKLIAIATDEHLEAKVRLFSLQDITGLADLLESGFIKPQQERISLYVNNILIPLTAFPRQVVNNVILTMVSCLKGVGTEIRSIDISFRKNSGRD